MVNENKKGKAHIIKKSKLKLFIKAALITFVILLIFGFTAGYFIYKKFSKGLPDVEYLREYKPSLITRIYSDDDELIGKYYVENRILVPIEKIPAILKQATIAVEDARFYSHFGIDLEGITRAFVKNINAGRLVQGGSTITQQLAKTLFLSPEKKITRKIKEAILAIRIEQKFTKDEILEFYLNQIYYGHGAYGVEAAANTYFNKNVRALTVGEAALIAGLPKAPRSYSPYFSLKRAKRRQRHVLNRMVAMDFLKEGASKAIKSAPFELSGRDRMRSKAPYFTEHIRKYLEKEYGASELYRSGMRIDTTLNLKAQTAAAEAVKRGLKVADKRFGYRGPVKQLNFIHEREINWEEIKKIEEKLLKSNKSKEEIEQDRNKRLGVVVKVEKNQVEVLIDYALKGIIKLKTMRWARKPNTKVDGKYKKIKDARKALKAGDLIIVNVMNEFPETGTFDLTLDQEPKVQGALVSVEPQTGYIKAMVGGYNFYESPFNRAIQAVRQAGSSFKPILYAAFLNKGNSPATIVFDTPIIFKDADYMPTKWKPENYEKKFFGPTMLREALTHSRNIVAVKILQNMGIKYAVDFAKKLGIKTPLNADLSLALGSSGVTLLNLTSVYGMFANHGELVKPVYIKSIKNSLGNIIEEEKPSRKHVLDPEIAYIITSMMKDVVKNGTGRKVKVLGRPTAAKTGTTNNFFDAWFVGFTSKLSTGVWVGMDKEQSLGINETGSRLAVPIWLEYMKTAVKGTPIEDFAAPPGVIFKKIAPEAGKLARIDTPGAFFETFVEGTEPTEFTLPAKAKSEDFFMLDLE